MRGSVPDRVWYASALVSTKYFTRGVLHVADNFATASLQIPGESCIAQADIGVCRINDSLAVRVVLADSLAAQQGRVIGSLLLQPLEVSFAVAFVVTQYRSLSINVLGAIDNTAFC